MMGTDGVVIAGRLLNFSLLGKGVSSFGNGGAVTGSQGTRLGQADGGIRSQTDVAPLFVDDDSLDPGFGAGGDDVQVEAVAAAMPAGLG